MWLLLGAERHCVGFQGQKFLTIIVEFTVQHGFSSHVELPRVTPFWKSPMYQCLLLLLVSITGLVSLLTTYCRLDEPHSLHKEGQGFDDLNG